MILVCLKLRRLKATILIELSIRFSLFIKGLGLNAINPGVLMFWIAACTYATNELKLSDIKLFTFFGITLSTLFIVDLVKNLLFKQTERKINKNTLVNNWNFNWLFINLFWFSYFFKDLST